MLKQQFTNEDDALLADLGIEIEQKKQADLTPREERIIAGFEDIQNFVEEKARVPQNNKENDIFERIYAVRLDKLQHSNECKSLLSEYDHQSLLTNTHSGDADIINTLDDETLLSELGVNVGTDSDITKLQHVKTRAEIKAAEEIAQRTKCNDFEQFKPLFDTVQNELEDNIRKTTPFRKDAGFAKTDIKQGHFIILGGQVAYIANIGEPIKAPNGEDDARLRVIYSNGTESDILLRSLIRAMYKDDSSRLISDITMGPLFSDEHEESDIESGTIYILRSKSEHPEIKQHHEILHKIGVTGGSVEKRIANAKDDPTFLMADVEVVATYQLSNINRVKLENLLHTFFDSARLNIEIKDRFGKPISPREWFLVPLFIIDEVVEKIKNATIVDYFYDYEASRVIAFDLK